MFYHKKTPFIYTLYPISSNKSGHMHAYLGTSSEKLNHNKKEFLTVTLLLG